MSITSKSIPHRLKVSFLYPMVGVIPLVFYYGSMILDKMVDFPALSSPINSSRAVELPILNMLQKKLQQSMQYQDELPCGGYEDEDAKIREQIKAVSEGKECQKEQCEGCECKGPKKEEQIVPHVKTFCKKCHKGRAILMHKGDPICQECLFRNMEYKCRLLLENTFKVKKDSNLLLCVSGGLNSISMVNIIVNLMKRYQKNKLFNQLACIHIQQQETLPEDYEERFKKETGIEIKVIKLQQALQKEGTKLDDVRKLLGMFNKNANTIDLLNILRDRLILKYAQQHNYQFVLKGHNGQALAAETFRYFSKGLGGNIPLLSPNDKQKGQFYYPLRNNLQKQIQYFYHVNRLAVLAIKSEENNIDYSTTSGLDGQIKQFIDTLQHMYSHTAPAIVRTAEKIQTNLKHENPCAWCLLPQDQDKICRRCQRLWEARKATLDKEVLPAWMMID